MRSEPSAQPVRALSPAAARYARGIVTEYAADNDVDVP